MSLLDALLAFAITMALLGTVVTMIMEVGHRVCRVRKGKLIVALKLLSREVGRGAFSAIDDRGKWDFIVSVLNNPASTKGKLPTSGPLSVDDARTFLPTALGQWMRKVAGTANSSAAVEAVDWGKAIEALGRVNGKRGVFDKVSLEHILRRLSELGPVRNEIDASFKKAEKEFNRLARKYMEFASSVSADFKRRSQWWSMIVGVLLALACNINGVLVFQAYLQNQELTTKTISSLDAVGVEIERTRKDLDKMTDDEKNGTVEQLKEQLQEINTTLSSLDALPIGTAYFPHNWIIEKIGLFENRATPTDTTTADNGSKAVKTEIKKEGGPLKLLTWFIATTLTGLLIGLGAPFWFDMAKRLATVRSMFGGQASTEERLGGKDVAADQSDDRQDLIRTILRDVLEENRLFRQLRSTE